MSSQFAPSSPNHVLIDQVKSPTQSEPVSSEMPDTLLDLVLQVTDLRPDDARSAVDRFLPGLKPWLKSPLAAIREEATAQIQLIDTQVASQVDRITRDHSFQQLRMT